MTVQAKKKTPEEMLEAIFALDLEPIKFKLMDKREGQGWSREQVDHYEMEYKRFLALMVKYPEEMIAPNTNVDKFWHGHILDTMKYAEDCDRVFGYFLHHYPYFGLRGEQDAANLANAFDTMQKLYEQEFGSAAAPAPAAWCGRATDKLVQQHEQSAAWCGRATGKLMQQVEQSPAWCGRATDELLQQGDQSAAWCGRATDKLMQQGEPSPAWCGRATDKLIKHAETLSA